MNLKKAIQTRKSIRRYSDKKPDWRKIIQALDSCRFAPMAGNMFTIRFILVQDPEKIEKIKQACQQDFVGQAQYIVVFASDNEKMKKQYADRGETFARQQAGATIENFLLTLNEKGLETCWTGYFSQSQIKKILEIPSNQKVEALFPIGLKTKVTTKPKPKPDLDPLIFFDKWGNRTMKPLGRIRQEWN